MATDKPRSLADLWYRPDTVYELSETERFAVPGVSVGMRCNIAQYKLLRELDGKQKPDWDKLRDELLALDADDAKNDDRPLAIWRQGAELKEAHLGGANLEKAHLEGANLEEAHLEGTGLWLAHLEGAVLSEAHLEGADLRLARLEGTGLWQADLEGADLYEAHLEGAGVTWAYLERADLTGAHLKGADLVCAHLEGADLSYASVDDKTLFHYCSINRKTNFEGVDLALCYVPPDLKTAMTHNLRESRWQRWYGPWPHMFYKWPVWLFWQLSDYGRSVHRILIWFVALSAGFAALYFTAAVACPPGIINNFLADENGCVSSPAMGMLRAFYFSIVTMTTLGFGDMHARVNEPWGHVLLMLQVVAGYFLLGVLVSRVTIAFQTVGPAQPLTKPPLRGRLVKWATTAVVCLALAAGGWIWHGWAVSEWPSVIEKAQPEAHQAANADRAPPAPAETGE